MSDKKVKYVVIGAGAICQRRHLPELHASSNAEIVGLADPNEERVKKIAEQYGCPAFTDHKEMLKKVKADAAVVGTPNALHSPQSVDCLNAGLHVLVEKPMATTREGAKAMLDAAKKNNKYLMIGMNQRLMPPHVLAKQILDTGKLGKIIAFETNFKHAGADGWSVDGIHSWFFKPELAGMGVCGDLGIHKADLMMYLTGEKFAKVGGFVKTIHKAFPDGKLIDVDDNAFLELETESGAIGSIHISWTNTANYGDNGTRLFCEKGMMRIGEASEWGVEVDLVNGQKERYKVGAMATNEKQTDSGVAAMLTRSILENKPVEIDGAEGYRALNVVITAIEAANEGVIKSIDNTVPA